MAERGGRLPRALLGLALMWLAVAPLAHAHAELREADPAVGAVYRWERPTAVRLSFSQKLQPEASQILVTNRRFETVQQGATQVPPDNPWAMTVALPDLPSGTYTVNWHTASVDGHPLDGAYDFTILPREPLITMGVAASVLAGMGLLVFARRARPGDD